MLTHENYSCKLHRAKNETTVKGSEDDDAKTEIFEGSVTNATEADQRDDDAATLDKNEEKLLQRQGLSPSKAKKKASRPGKR